MQLKGTITFIANVLDFIFVINKIAIKLNVHGDTPKAIIDEMKQQNKKHKSNIHAAVTPLILFHFAWRQTVVLEKSV